jgi:hypothetical protein
MKTDQIVMCVVALLLGMLLANMLKNVCGCKVVEGGGTQAPSVSTSLLTTALAQEYEPQYKSDTTPYSSRVRGIRASLDQALLLCGTACGGERWDMDGLTRMTEDGLSAYELMHKWDGTTTASATAAEFRNKLAILKANMPQVEAAAADSR